MEPNCSTGDTALEVHFEMKIGKHAFQETFRDMWAQGVFERPMSLEERKQVDPSKQKEIKNDVVNDVLETLEPHERPLRESRLRTRWVLECRLDENENKSPKSRIVTLRYLDLSYETGPAASPTMTRNTRQLLLPFGSWMGFSAAKETSVERSRKAADFVDLWVLPAPELAAALNVVPWRDHEVEESSPRTGCSTRGMVHQYIYSTGGIRMVSPEIRPVRIDNTLGVMTRCECAVTAANGGHVDDFVFVGKEGHKVWKQQESNYKTIFVGRCGNMTTSYTAAPQWNTKRTKDSCSHRTS